MSEVCGIILAAGEGKRMKSNLPKVLSRVLDKPMLKWVIDAARGAGIEALCVVDGFKREEVERYLATLPEAYETAFQAERKGTAHAVMQARGFLERHRDGDVLILNGDAPFLDEETIRKAYPEVGEGNIGVGSTIFAVKPGDGSAREQAASCQKVLGGWANIANEYATKRYRSNLINWGMLPFLTDADHEALPFKNGEYLFVPDVRNVIEKKQSEVKAYVVGAELKEITLRLGDMTDAEREIILKGCLINYYKG